MRRSQALARDDHLDDDELPSTDTLVQAASSSTRGLPTDADEIGRDPECGDQKFHARDADSSP